MIHFLGGLFPDIIGVKVYLLHVLLKNYILAEIAIIEQRARMRSINTVPQYPPFVIKIMTK